MKHILKGASALALGMSLFGGAAFAQDNWSVHNYSYCEGGVAYADVDAGGSSDDDESPVTSLNSSDGTGFFVGCKSDFLPWGLHLYGEYRNQNFDVDAIGAEGGELPANISGDGDLDTLRGGIGWSTPFILDNLSVYGEVGVTYTDSDVSASNLGDAISDFDGDDSTFGAEVEAGGRFMVIQNRWEIGGGARYGSGEGVEFNDSLDSIDSTDNWSAFATTQVRVYKNFSVGARYEFGDSKDTLLINARYTFG